ncbi:hypothetical protein EON65_57840 [archaeon]|nr:MAG: hypothetical protein EON65_57840 [archaeon]
MRVFLPHFLVRCVIHASSLSSTVAIHRGQYMELGGAGRHLGDLFQLSNSFALMAKPESRREEWVSYVPGNTIM